MRASFAEVSGWPLSAHDLRPTPPVTPGTRAAVNGKSTDAELLRIAPDHPVFQLQGLTLTTQVRERLLAVTRAARRYGLNLGGVATSPGFE